MSQGILEGVLLVSVLDDADATITITTSKLIYFRINNNNNNR
jgi:hypothetical protein